MPIRCDSVSRVLRHGFLSSLNPGIENTRHTSRAPTLTYKYWDLVHNTMIVIRAAQTIEIHRHTHIQTRARIHSHTHTHIQGSVAPVPLIFHHHINVMHWMMVEMVLSSHLYQIFKRGLCRSCYSYL